MRSALHLYHEAIVSDGPSVVLVDRDGVINRMRPDYVKTWQELELLPGAIESLVRLERAGCEVVVLTNQSAIGRGLASREDVDEIHRRLSALVREAGGRIAAFLLCPHAPLDGCDCRKPAPGLLLRARDEFGFDLSRAVLVGDQMSDLDAARAAGCAAILVDPDGDKVSPLRPHGYVVASSLREAVDIILKGR
jgi:D-glycero-D-manno-heptose 1,7-bisphosphate phosphatase